MITPLSLPKTLIIFLPILALVINLNLMTLSRIILYLNPLLNLNMLNRSPIDFNKIDELELSLDKHLLEEEVFWKQRSREHWLKWGDHNTKWFYKKANYRRKKNEIKSICDCNNFWLENEKDIAHCFASYFSNLFASSNPSLAYMDCVLSKVKKLVTNDMTASSQPLLSKRKLNWP